MTTRLRDALFNDRFAAKIATGTAANRPASPEGDGDAYYATDTNVLSIGDNSAWVEFGSVIASGTAANRPANPTADGDTYYATDTDTLSIGDNNAWVEFSSGGGGGAGTLVAAVFFGGSINFGSSAKADLNFTTEVNDTDGWFDSATSNTNFSLDKGIYRATVQFLPTVNISGDLDQHYITLSAEGTSVDNAINDVKVYFNQLETVTSRQFSTSIIFRVSASTTVTIAVQGENIDDGGTATSYATNSVSMVLEKIATLP